MSRKSNVDSFGGADYRRGALERLREAQLLLSNENFAGSIYLAGRGVEGMLRAVIWERDAEIRRGRKPLETGHDLRQLLILVRKLGLLRPAGREDEFEAAVHRVSRLWRNHLRFASTRMIETWWWDLGEVHKRRTIKQAAAEFFRSCSFVAKRCETL
jgi:hypothetical protein